LDSCYCFHSPPMHLFNCQVLLNFVRKLRCPINSLTIVALSMGMTHSLLKMVVLFLLTWQLIDWIVGYSLSLILFPTN